LHLEGPTVDIARLDAQLKPVIDSVFHDARRQGRRESYDAYAYDALLQLLDQTDDATDDQIDAADGATNAEAGNEPVRRPRGRIKRKRRGRHWGSKVIVRADLTALDRGHVEAGEVCEIAGHGPIPVTDAWNIIDGDAFIAGLLTHGTDIERAQHLGRHPTALQRTVLEWRTAGTCTVEGCTNTAAIELDHIDDWAHTHLTQITQLAALCRTCHAKKTYQGYTLGPLLPNGKRRLIPPSNPQRRTIQAGGTPEAPARPDDPDELASNDPDDPPPRPHDALGPHDPDQPGLFDTS
jgi:hypothetical protein